MNKMSIKLLIILQIIICANVEAFMYRNHMVPYQAYPIHIHSGNSPKLNVAGNLMTITCADHRTLVWLPIKFPTYNIINHIKFIDCFSNKSNLINYDERTNDDFNLNQLIIKYNLNINAHQLTVEFNKMSEIRVNPFFDNFKFNTFKELNLINVNFLNQTLLGLFTSITKLKFSSNYEINLNYFKTVNSVEFLTVHKNTVKSFKLERFKNLVLLEMVDCDINFNEFNIPNFFAMNNRLFSLKMEGNFKTNERIELNENLFNGLNKLKSLTFSNENLYDLPVGIFRNLGSLLQLNLANNRLEYLPKEILYNNELLEAIDLSNNNLKEITDAHFAKTPYLMHITLRYNHLSTIQYNSSLQNSIQFMDLSYNQIQFDNSSECPIITGAIQHLRINLAYNKIQSTKPIECMISDHNIQQLNVSGNYLTEFNLFQLAMNKIQHKTLSQLILSNNQITKVDLFEIFDWDSYEAIPAYNNLIVDLDGNPVLCDNCSILRNIFDQPFVNIKYKDAVIRFIHPHYCKITSFCDIEEYHQLEYDCPIGCSCTYNEFVLIFRLNCSNSALTEVPQIPYPSFVFSEIELVFDNNLIETFSMENQYYDVCNKITKLSIKNNSLVEFSLPYEKYPLHLVELHLDDNKLKTFSNQTLSILNIAETNLNVSLRGNQFCDNQTYYESFINSYQFNLIDDISCNVKTETLIISQYTEKKITISNLAIILITLFSIVAVICVIGVLLFLKTKRKFIFLSSRFVNHRRMDEGSVHLGEGLLGEDEI